MQSNLGRCHYGREDDATMIGARADGPGWIGVCSGHRDDAEREGYVLHELAVVDDCAPSKEQQPPPRPTYEEAEQPAYEPSVGLDILDEPYPFAPEDRPVR